MNRLTKRDGRIAVHVGGCTKRADPVFEKLAQYEDLEEAGRLVVLPEKFDKEKAWSIFISKYCPLEFGLQDMRKVCPKRTDCEKCWKTALKGGHDDNQ